MPGEPPGPSDPLDAAGLVGRAAEAAAIRRMLDGPPLVTVTGLPGVGKTAVRLTAARAAAAGFADGSLLLRIDRLRYEALLPHTIAAALRLPDQYTRSRLDMLVDQLRDRHLLLILDTCEHLLGACAALAAALLPPCPKMIRGIPVPQINDKSPDQPRYFRGLTSHAALVHQASLPSRKCLRQAGADQGSARQGRGKRPTGGPGRGAAGADGGRVPRVRALLSPGRGRARTRA
jgi:hypothetical protein